MLEPGDRAAGCARPHKNTKEPGRRDMRSWNRSHLAVALTVWAWCGTHAAQAAPLEAYGRLPSVEDVALSPDGSKLAFIRTTADVRVMAIVAVADHKLLGGAKLGEVKLRRLWWADDDHLLIMTSATEQANGTIGRAIEYPHLDRKSVV